MKRLIAAASVLLIAAASPPKQHSSTSQASAADHINSPLESAPGAQAIAPVETKKDENPCGAPQNHDRCELDVERKSAEAARDAAEWAKVQAIFSGLGILGLLVSLWFTRAATNAATAAGKDAEKAIAIAERNATAVAEQVDVAREVSERHLRAYVGVASIKALSASNDKFGAKLMLRNYGLTPAYKVAVKIGAQIDVFPRAQSTDESFLEPQIREATLYPSAEIPVFAGCQLDGRRQEIVEGDAAMYVVGYVSYVDVQGISRRSNFAFRGTQNTLLTNGEMHVCLTGNGAD